MSRREHLVAAPIVGVVGDVRNIGGPRRCISPLIHVSTLVVRSTANPLTSGTNLARRCLAVDPSQPVFDVQTATQLVDRSDCEAAFPATLLGLFSCWRGYGEKNTG